MQTIRSRLGELQDVTIRLRDFAAPGCFPRCGYPIDLALHGLDPAEVRQWATQLVDRLRRTKELTDMWMNTDCLP